MPQEASARCGLMFIRLKPLAITCRIHNAQNRPAVWRKSAIGVHPAEDRGENSDQEVGLRDVGTG